VLVFKLPKRCSPDLPNEFSQFPELPTRSTSPFTTSVLSFKNTLWLRTTLATDLEPEITDLHQLEEIDTEVLDLLLVVRDLPGMTELEVAELD
jgi:hypothetical protein